MTHDIDPAIAELGAGPARGPLGGYHHRIYALELRERHARDIGHRFAKIYREQPGATRFDLRFFTCQDTLLESLRGLVPRLPEVVRIRDRTLHHFIEGRDLGTLRPVGTSLDDNHIAQIGELFGHIVSVPLDCLPGPRSEDLASWPDNRDTPGFFRRLVTYTRQEAVESQHEEFGTLFEALGIRDDCLDLLLDASGGLTRRPFSLLHGDLHRGNIIVDPGGLLWPIDWELALIGDPLYDLATHLHLMHYPDDQLGDVVDRWRAAAERARPGASEGMRPDLALYLDFKRVQSVWTDVVRAAQSVRSANTVHHLLGKRVHAVLDRAAGPLGLTSVPRPSTVEAAYRDWLHAQQDDANSALSTSLRPEDHPLAGVGDGAEADLLVEAVGVRRGDHDTAQTERFETISHRLQQSGADAGAVS